MSYWLSLNSELPSESPAPSSSTVGGSVFEKGFYAATSVAATSLNTISSCSRFCGPFSRNFLALGNSYKM